MESSGLELPDVVVAIEASKVISLPPLSPGSALGLTRLPSKEVLGVVGLGPVSVLFCKCIVSTKFKTN